MSGYNEQGMMKMKTMTRRLANGDHRARCRELTGVSTAPEVRGRAYGWSDHRARGSVRYAIVRYTLFQQVNPIEHATIVSDQIGVESVDESSHRRTVTTKHDISDAILSANVRQRTLKSLAIIRAQRPLATGGGTKYNQESSIVDIGTKKIHVISPTHPPTHPTHDNT